MTSEELRQYADRVVELQLHDGERVVGRLVLGGDGTNVPRTPFAIEQPEAAPNAGPVLRRIQGAALVKWAKVLDEAPETFD